MGGFIKSLGGFFDSQNRRYEMQWLLTMIACIVGIGLEIFVVLDRGPYHQNFNFREFGEGLGALIGMGGVATALVSLGQKTENQGNAAQIVAEKVQPENITASTPN